MGLDFQRLEETAKAMKPIFQTGKSFHVTFVFKKNKFICAATNNYNKQHPYHRFGEYKATKSNSPNYQSGLHSEVAALIKLGKEDCSEFKFVNIRINNENEPAQSKPCKNCQKVLDQVGYKEIWFMQESGKYCKIKSGKE